MQNTFLRSTTGISAVVVSVFFPIMANAQTDNPPTKDMDLDEIIVTGSPLSATKGTSLVGVSIIGGEKLARNLQTSLGETLKKTPGISSTFFGPGASRPIIRGQGGARIRILDNGIGSIDAASSSPDHAGSVKPAMASRIEIIRGSALLRYGSSASGGVINVIDGRIPDKIPDTSITGAIRIGASSVDNGYETALGADFRLGRLGGGGLVGHMDASFSKSEDYNIPGLAESDRYRAAEAAVNGNQVHEQLQGKLANSASKSRALSAGFSWIHQNSILGLAIRNLDSAYGIPGSHEEINPVNINTEIGEGVTIDLKQARVDGLGRFELGGLFEAITFNGGYGDYQHSEIEPDGNVGTVFTNEGFEFRAEILQAPRGNWRAAYGIQHHQRDFAAVGEEAFVPPTNSIQQGVFTFQELSLGDLHLEAGARYEYNRHDNSAANIARSFESFSLSAGVDYQLTDTLRLGGTIFRTSRAPTSEELFSNGPHLATNQFEIGDLCLGEETASGGEISIRYRKNSHYLSVNLFATGYNDFIYGRSTGLFFDGLPISQFSAAAAVFKGFEIETGATIAEFQNFDIRVDASVEYVDANIGTDGQALPRIPPLGVMLGLDLETDSWSFRLEIDHAATQNDIAPGELVTDAYTLVNLQTSYHINDSLTIYASLNNIFNQDARQHTSFLKEILPMPARNLKISVSRKF